MRRLICAVSAALSAAAVTGVSAQQVAGNEFNPAISLILNGRYSHYSVSLEDYELPGLPVPAEARPTTEGLTLDETELAVSANVDDKYYGLATAAIADAAGETEVELEEAYFETLALPRGFKIKAGKFLSDIGYLNPIHSHAWDFADTPLVYAAFLGTAYSDIGIQARWVAPTPVFLEIGGELMRGEAFPAAGAADHGTGAATLFVHIGGDVGTGSSWRAGFGKLAADASDRMSELAAGPTTFTGTSDLWVADFVWKWAANGNPRDRNFVIQGEYMQRDEAGSLAVETPLSGATGEYSGDHDGFYLQGVYQFRPRWRIGARYDRIEARNDVALAVSTPLQDAHVGERQSLMVDFSNSEFSRLRLQWNRDDTRPEHDDQIFLQYVMSLGAHGAHRF
jgi:hypothetical protein